MPPLWRWVVFANLCREKIWSLIINSRQSECRDNLRAKSMQRSFRRPLAPCRNNAYQSGLTNRLDHWFVHKVIFAFRIFMLVFFLQKKKKKTAATTKNIKKKSLLYLGVLMWWQLLRLTVNILCQFTANGSHLSTVVIKNGPGQPFLRLTVKIVSFCALRLFFWDHLCFRRSKW